MGSKWTKQEIEILRKEYPNTSSKSLTLKNRTSDAIVNRASMLGLKAEHRNWSFPREVHEYPICADLAYMTGAILGDGWVSKKSYRGRFEIKFASKDYEFVHAVQGAYLNVLGKCPIVTKRPNNPSYIYEMTVSDKSLNLFLNQPLETLLEAVKPFSLDFVRGFYDAEGSASKYKTKTKWANKEYVYTQQHISFYNTNIKLLEFVRDILIANGINPSPNIYKSGIGTYGKIHSKMCYVIRVSRKADVALFAQKIKSSIPRKNLVIE